MSAGATDGRFLRNAGIPTYGTSGLAGDIHDVRAPREGRTGSRQSFNDGQEYLYRLVKVLSSNNKSWCGLAENMAKLRWAGLDLAASS